MLLYPYNTVIDRYRRSRLAETSELALLHVFGELSLQLEKVLIIITSEAVFPQLETVVDIC
jgi:hypothetical protein